MSIPNKQFTFTNEILYERNISDRIWPMFLKAQIETNLQDAITALKCYYLFTQHWYQNRSAEIGERIEQVKLAPRAITLKQAEEAVKLKFTAWKEVNELWKIISNQLQDYGLFKRSYVPDTHQLAIRTS